MPGKNAYLNISGIHEEDAFTKDMIDREVTAHVQRWSRFSLVDEIKIRVKKHKGEGKRVKYSVNAELATNFGIFHANDFSWKLFVSLKNVLEKLERELEKRKGKETSVSKATKKRVELVGKPKGL